MWNVLGAIGAIPDFAIVLLSVPYPGIVLSRYPIGELAEWHLLLSASAVALSGAKDSAPSRHEDKPTVLTHHYDSNLGYRMVSQKVATILDASARGIIPKMTRMTGRSPPHLAKPWGRVR